MKWEKEKEKEKGVKGESERERYKKEQRESDLNIERKREIGTPKETNKAKHRNSWSMFKKPCPFLYNEWVYSTIMGKTVLPVNSVHAAESHPKKMWTRYTMKNGFEQKRIILICTRGKLCSR